MKTTTLNSETFTADVTQLYARYRDFVVRICLRYVQNPHEAEDLTQEIFLKAGAAWQAFGQQCQPSTWLYRIAVNRCLDHLRSKKRRRDQLESYALESPVVGDSEEDETPSIMRRILNQLRMEMDSMDKEIIYLRFELGFTHQAIAEICGVSRVAITKRLVKITARATVLHTEFQNEEDFRIAA
jgi:RNA polymerase sigma factor (sigma-70 family)